MEAAGGCIHMSYQDALTTAREQMLMARKELDELIASLDRMLGVPARQIVPNISSPRKVSATRKVAMAGKKAAPTKQGRGKLAGREDEIKAAVLAGEKLGVIAKRLGVHFTSVGKLAQKRGWKAGRSKSADGVPIRKLPRGVSGRPE
jgi:uncharacterized protein YjcR